MEYTVEVAEAGLFDLGLHVSSPVGGEKLRVEFDGEDKTGTLEVPKTGNWSTWRTITKPRIRLRGGRQIMRIMFESVPGEPGQGDAGHVCNLDWIKIDHANEPAPRRTELRLGQWSSPLTARVNGAVQVIAPQGDGWVRSFEASSGKLVWAFDANPNPAVYPESRNDVISIPVLYDDRVYVATGQASENGEGPPASFGTSTRRARARWARSWAPAQTRPPAAPAATASPTRTRW